MPPHIMLTQALKFTSMLIKRDPNETSLIEDVTRQMMATILPDNWTDGGGKRAFQDMKVKLTPPSDGGGGPRRDPGPPFPRRSRRPGCSAKG